MKNINLPSCLILAFAACGLFGGQAIGQAPDSSSGFAGIPTEWLSEYTTEINAQVERFGTAYSLTTEQQSALRQTLVDKLPEQWSFASKGFQAVQQQLDAAIARGDDLEADTEENRTIMNQFLQIGEIGPLSDLVVAKEIESRLAPDVAEQGRARLVDLLARRDQIAAAKDDDFELQSAHNGSLADAKVQAEAPLSGSGNPLPRGSKLDTIAPEAVAEVGGSTPPSLPVTPNAMTAGMSADAKNLVADAASVVARENVKPDLRKVQAAADALLAEPAKADAAKANVEKQSGRTAKEAVAKPRHENAAAKPQGGDRLVARGLEAAEKNPRDAGPSRPMPAAVEAVRLQAAPPLDDWDKYVDTTCKKFEFSDAQVIKAQSILKDLRNRASAYRTSRNEDFAAAERLADAKAKADRKKELSAPIDAFFEELKQRLDNLATLEQRAKASASAPGKK